MDYLKTENTYLANVIQGELWLKKYNNLNNITIPLNLYFDEFETRNPLESRAGEEKLGAVYISIACLPPHINAKLRNIFLSTIFHSKHLKSYGNEKIFKRLIKELNLLSETGITMMLNGTEKIIYFQCILILGDNLGQNIICGLTDSFKSKRFCRICYASNEECQEMIEKIKALFRDKKSYEKDIAEGNFSNSGLKEECVFNKINKFAIYENPSLDVMHDINEGVIPYTISKVIEGIIRTEKITLGMINNRIEIFDYNELKKSNKPRPLFYCQGKKGGKIIKIKQSASESLCLARYLGLMIGDLVHRDNSYWKLYMHLRKIIAIVTSHTLHKGQIQNLTDMIKKHNKLYIKLVGKLKPFGFLLHYPFIMTQNGPAIHFSAMRYERKNRELKEFAVGTSSNINLPLTIAIKHQLELCYETEFCPPIQNNIILGPLNNSNAYNDLKKLLPNIPNGLPTITLKHIELLGDKLCAGTVFISRISENRPHFSIIKNIFYCNDVYFQAEELETLYFHSHYHAYCVQSVDKPRNFLINVNLLPKTSPCLFVTKDDSEFVATRFEI